MGNNQFGVSPAFFLSLYGPAFLPEDVCSVLPLVRRLGFQCFQVEIYDAEKLVLWINGGADGVRAAAEQEGLKVSQLVAHFLIPSFETEEAIARPWDESRIGKLFEIAARLCPGVTVTIPLGPYRGRRTLETGGALVRRLRCVAMEGERRGFHTALEVQPHAFIRGVGEIEMVLDKIGHGMGYNFDTGHGWAMGDRVEKYPELLQGRIFGTHLCDNHGRENLSLCPGEGTIDFQALLDGLCRTGYSGSLDLEIFTDKRLVEQKYSKGLRFLKNSPSLKAQRR